MKLRFIFLSIFFLATSQISARESKLTVYNEFYGPIKVTAFKSNLPTTPRELRTPLKSSPFELKVGKERDLKFGSLKKSELVFVWLEITFQNGATFPMKVIQLGKDEEKKLNITKELFQMPLTSSSKKSFDELRTIFYSDIHILEQDVQNQRSQFLSLFGGLAIVKIDTINGDKNRLNYLESRILGRTVSEDDVFKQNDIRNHDYIFKDSFLYEELNSRKNLIPGIKRFAQGLQQKGELFEIHYMIKGLDNYISYSDSVALEQRWYDIDKELRNIFLEDYISAVERKEDAAKIEVREYNRAAGFQYMTVEIDKYGPVPMTDNKAIQLVTEDGPYYLAGREVYQDLLGDQILALGYDEEGVNHTEWIREKALSYLDELIKQRKPKSGSYLDKLNKLGIQGYYQVKQSEYLLTLKNIKADLLEEY